MDSSCSCAAAPRYAARSLPASAAAHAAHADAALASLTSAGSLQTIVAILASHGIRYVAHPMWGAIKAEAAAALPVPPNMDKEAEVVQWKSSEYSPK